MSSEEKVLDLQSRSSSINKRLTKAWRILKKEEVTSATVAQDEEYELKAMIVEIHKTCDMYRRMQTVFDLFIPKTAQLIILQCMVHNEATDSWSLPCIAYSGNNIDQVPESDISSSFGIKKAPGRQVILRFFFVWSISRFLTFPFALYS